MKPSLFIAVIGTFVLSACSSGGGGGSGGEAGLAKLSPEQQAAYQAWLKAPIKSCDAIDVVGGNMPSGPSFPESAFPGMPAMPPPSKARETEKGLDLAVLSQRTGGSLLISDSANSETFAILAGSATGFTSGVQNSKYEASVNVNGSEQKVKVETTSSGFNCTVKINDVEVAKLALAKTVDVGGASARATTFQPVDQKMSEAISEYGGVTLLDTHELQKKFESVMQDEAVAKTQIVRLGYSQEEAGKYFQLRGGAVAGRAFGIEFAKPSITFVSAPNQIVMPPKFVTQLPRLGESRTLTLAAVLRTGGGSIGGIDFGSQSTQVTTIRRQINLTSAGGNLTIGDAGRQTVVASIPTSAEADQCVVDRLAPYANLYMARLRGNLATEIPARRTLFQSCSVYEESLESRLNADGGARKALNAMLRGVSRELIKATGAKFSFGDWAGFVRESTSAALDPNSTATLADGLDAYILNEMDRYIADAKQTASYAQFPKTLRPALADLIFGLGSNSRGVAIESPLIGNSIQAGLKLGEGYEVPFGRLLNTTLMRPETIESGLRWIQLTATPSLLQVGREAADEARALDYQPYLTETHLRFFEVQPTEASLIAIRDRMRSIRSNFSAFPQLGSIKGKLATVLLQTNVDANDVPSVIQATAHMTAINEAIASTYLDLVQQGPGSVEEKNARFWGLTLTATDQKAVQDYLQYATVLGDDSEALKVIREMPKTRPASAELQARVAAYQLANQFQQAEASRAKASTRDMFYESDAKDMARRIGREMFSAADVASLETFAQVSASDGFCGGDNKTISLRLKCAGLDRFSKLPRKLLSSEYQGRYVAFATKAAGWMQQLVPQQDHSTVRRNLKNSLFGSSDAGPWGACQASQYDVNNRALDQAMQVYIQSMGDFSARFKAERAVSAALDVRCQ